MYLFIRRSQELMPSTLFGQLSQYLLSNNLRLQATVVFAPYTRGSSSWFSVQHAAIHAKHVALMLKV